MNRSLSQAIAAAILFSIAAGAGVAAAAKAAKSKPAEKPVEIQPWTVDDLITNEVAGEYVVSPDGRRVAWLKITSDTDKDERVQNLYLSSLTEKREIQLTRGADTISNPRWSPDGKLLAFVSDRAPPKGDSSSTDSDEGPRSQIWLLNPDGGEPYPLTSGARSVEHFEWLDASTILFSAKEDPGLYEQERKDKKDDTIVVEDEPHEPPVRLFSVDLDSKDVARISNNTDWIDQFAVSPDGHHAVAIHNRSLTYTYDQKIKPVTYLYDLGSGERKPVFADLNPEEFRWTRDGKGLYVGSAFTHDTRYLNATISLLYYYDVATGKTTPVNLDWPNGLSVLYRYINGMQVTSDGFIAPLANGVHPRLARYTGAPDGKSWTREWIYGDHQDHIFSLSLGGDDKSIVYAYSTASTPEQLVRAELHGASIVNPTVLTDLNEGFRNRTIAKSEIVHWKGARGDSVEGILYYPHHFESGKKYPLVLSIHGGPAWADFDSWSESWASPYNLLAQRGAFVLEVNYHGSSEYGLDWLESISGGKYYDLEVPDIENGVDSLIALGLVDPARLGVMGWSNGSILTIELTTRTTRYKAASAGAGDVDWASDWGNCAFGAAFDNYYFGANPLKNPRAYLEKSPFFQMDKVKTPTLIFFGTDDTTVPTEQGWMHYRALQQLGQTAVRFVLFPGEGHSPEKLSHRRRKVEEELAWFDKYLFATAAAKDEALKSGSLLDVALKLKGVAQSGGRYGSLVNGVLVPEVLKHGDIEVGRFEVTRAQFAAFDPSYHYDPGTDNYPANGITFDQAKAYADWLARTTGQPFRLLTEEEGGDLYASGGADENTLDYWAGYEVNPDDAVRLAAEVHKLGPGALLRPVGSFSPLSDDELIFDIGGNVAEWVVTADGTGKAMGASADTPKDSKIDERKPAPDYIGFRIALSSK